jgi:hypothetical protein
VSFSCRQEGCTRLSRIGPPHSSWSSGVNRLLRLPELKLGGGRATVRVVGIGRELAVTDVDDIVQRGRGPSGFRCDRNWAARLRAARALPLRQARSLRAVPTTRASLACTVRMHGRVRRCAAPRACDEAMDLGLEGAHTAGSGLLTARELTMELPDPANTRLVQKPSNRAIVESPLRKRAFFILDCKQRLSWKGRGTSSYVSQTADAPGQGRAACEARQFAILVPCDAAGE